MVSASEEVLYSSTRLNALSEFRHLVDDQMYIAGYYSGSVRVINNPDGSKTWSNKLVLSSTFSLRYYVPMQKVIKAAQPGAEEDDLYALGFKQKSVRGKRPLG